MNKLMLAFKTFFIAILSFAVMVLLASAVQAGCCTGSHGYWFNGCCYSGGSECCAVEDVDPSCEIIPCENCEPEDPPCEECTLGSCPAPLTDSGDAAYKLSDYRSCENSGSCDDSHKYGDCYEHPNAIPTASLQIFPNGTPTSMGCSSSTYTGVEVNNPIRMVATYTDTDGSADIEAGYVWLKTQAVAPATPQYYDPTGASGQSGKTYTNWSWGFMMHKEGSNWVPYIPSLVGGGNDKWVKAAYASGRFAIKGPSQQDMLYVQVNSVTASGNNVVVDFSLDFRNIPQANQVEENTYYIYVMVNDVFGFTPYDNYGPSVTKIGDYFDPNEIRSYASWINSGKTWKIDFTPPEINSFTTEVTGPTSIRFNWDIGDLKSLYGLVGNVYISDGVTDPYDLTNISASAPGVTFTGPSSYTLHTQGSSVIGSLNTDYIVKGINMSGTSKAGTINMNVNGNREGSLVQYVTAYDAACNYNQDHALYNLEDWIVTYGGLLYSSNGVDFTVKNIDDANLWSPIALLNKLNPLYSDISSEMYGNVLSNPRSLEKSTETKSYMISPFSAYKVYDFYTDVKTTFERREAGINVTRMNPATATLTGSLGGGSTKVLDRDGNLTVGDANPYLCNGKAMFFVSGNLTINNEILNSNYNSDACIFVVNGNVVINAGPNSSGAGLGYDEINAYILVNGTVTINQDSSFDGLYISGGIQTLGGMSMDRFLSLNYRNTHPLLVVNHHSKYGIFSSTLIGNPVDMVKVEVGFKPF